MDFRARLKQVFSLAFLGFTAYACLATSQSNTLGPTVQGSFYIVSDCVKPTLEGNIAVANSTIVTPAGQSFLDYGFPQPSITFLAPVNGVLNGLNRSCYVTYGQTDSNRASSRWIFSCFDNGNYACSIYMEPH